MTLSNKLDEVKVAKDKLLVSIAESFGIFKLLNWISKKL